MRRLVVLGLAGLLGACTGSEFADADARMTVDVGAAPTVGPADAAVVFVEFADFECPYCGLEEPVVRQLMADYADRVLFVYKHFPLSFHPHARLAAEASLAAQAQGQFWAYHDVLYANQDALGRTALDGYAQSLGLDMTAFAAALDQHTEAPAVDADKAQGEALGVPGTPTFFINGRMGVGALDYDVLAEVIDEELP
ncbi:MAG: thioredoxin domain-containing protein [Polyangiaceae bacterium]|nr:thioredoxin domain-containing protein [Polyangiaceae bacterium]